MDPFLHEVGFQLPVLSQRWTMIEVVKIYSYIFVTRATFETSNYPRRPWDRYTAPNSKCIGTEHTPPPQKKKNEKLFILVISLVEKIGRTVKQCSDLKTSSIPLQSLEAQLSSLSLVTVLLILFVCHVHSGSHQYSWFSRISSTEYCCQSI